MAPAEGEADFESESGDDVTLSAFEDVLQGWAKALQLAEWAEGARCESEGSAGTGALHSCGTKPALSSIRPPALSQVSATYCGYEGFGV